jgi:hypothetical protein
MLTATAMSTKDRYATRQTLQSINWTTSGINGTGNLSPRARRLLQLYVSIVKMSYTGLSAPLGAISDTLTRALDGSSASVRTIQRANRELAESNFVFIYQCRTKFCRIKFNLEAFSFWTGRKSHKITPLNTNTHNVVSCETMSHSVLHTPNCRTVDRTNIPCVVNSRNITDLKQQQRAGARASNIRSKNRKNPVIFSLLCVLRSAKGMHPSDRQFARKRAQCEWDALGAGVELVNPSGVDWQYWSGRWSEMPISVRESTINREILPVLLNRGAIQSGEPCIPPPTVTEHIFENPSTPSPIELSNMLNNLKNLMSAANSPPKASIPIAAVLPQNNLSAAELAILDGARRRARGER